MLQLTQCSLLTVVLAGRSWPSVVVVRSLEEACHTAPLVGASQGVAFLGEAFLVGPFQAWVVRTLVVGGHT